MDLTVVPWALFKKLMQSTETSKNLGIKYYNIKINMLSLNKVNGTFALF